MKFILQSLVCKKLLEGEEMNSIRKLKWFVFSCVFLFAHMDVDSKTLIHAGKLIDGKSDQVQSRISIVIDGNIISDIKKGLHIL